MRMSKGAEVSTHPQLVKLDLPPTDLKLDKSATYLSWLRRIKGALAGRNLESGGIFDKREGETEAGHCQVERIEDHTHVVVYLASQLYGFVDCDHGG
jgi:hypothetical protein